MEVKTKKVTRKDVKIEEVLENRREFSCATLENAKRTGFIAFFF